MLGIGMRVSRKKHNRIKSRLIYSSLPDTSMKILARFRFLSLPHVAGWVMGLAMAWSVTVAAAPKTDIVYLKNGDRITGEVKSLLRGQLEFKTDDMGTVLIEWDKIEQIVSKTSQSVELSNGTRFFGPLAKPEDDDALRIKTEQGEVSVDTLDVISMYPVEAGIWERFDFDVKFGFSWDKSSRVGKYSLGMDAMWRDPRFITRASFVSETTTQEEQ